MLDLQHFFIRERAGMFKLQDTYDILDPNSQQQIAIAQERPHPAVQVLRLLVNKRLLPTHVHVHAGTDAAAPASLQFSLHKSLFSTVTIKDRSGRLVGTLRSKLLNLGGAFRVFDAQGQEIALVKGNWHGGTYRLLNRTGEEVGVISKKWAGLGRELFTSADNYMVAFNRPLPNDDTTRYLAAALAVDILFNER